MEPDGRALEKAALVLAVAVAAILRAIAIDEKYPAAGLDMFNNGWFVDTHAAVC